MEIILPQFLSGEPVDEFALDTSFLERESASQIGDNKKTLSFNLPGGKFAYLVEKGNNTRFAKGPKRSALRLAQGVGLSLDLLAHVASGRPSLTMYLLQYDVGGKRLRHVAIPFRWNAFHGSFVVPDDVKSYTIAIRVAGSGEIEFKELRVEERTEGDDFSVVSDALAPMSASQLILDPSTWKKAWSKAVRRTNQIASALPGVNASFPKRPPANDAGKSVPSQDVSAARPADMRSLADARDDGQGVLLVANPAFEDVRPADGSFVAMQALAPGWNIDFLEGGAEPNIGISQSDARGGLRVEIWQAPRWIRLLAPLRLASAGPQPLHADIVLRAQGAGRSLPVLDGVFVLERGRDGRWTMVCRLLGAISNGGNWETYSGSARCPRLEPGSSLFFAVQIAGQPVVLDIEAVSLTGIEAEQSPSKLKPLDDSAQSQAAPRPIANGRERGSIAQRRLVLLNPTSSRPDVSGGKPRMAVVCSNLSQNGFGRAHTIADIARRKFEVELVGMLGTRGARMWAPLSDSAIPVRGFVADSAQSLLAGAHEASRVAPCDVVYVSKPRFPGLLVGMMMSHRNNCPLLLDIDELEYLSAGRADASSFDKLLEEIVRHPPERDDPTGELWSRVAALSASRADAVTLSNAALMRRYEGLVLRHARDEATFVPDAGRRRRARKELGLRNGEKAVVFLGTPRPHKGITRLAQALSRRENRDIVLCVIGIGESDPLRQALRGHAAVVRMLGPQPFARIPDFINGADAVCLLQDAASTYAEFQVPAKLSDALAMGVPILGSRVAPLADLIACDAVIPIDNDQELDKALTQLADGSLHGEAERSRRRSLFLSEFSYAANLPRLELACALAAERYPQRSAARSAMLRKILDVLGTRGTVLPQHRERDGRSSFLQPSI